MPGKMRSIQITECITYFVRTRFYFLRLLKKKEKVNQSIDVRPDGSTHATSNNDFTEKRVTPTFYIVAE